MKGQLPEALSDKIQFMMRAYLDPWIISGFIFAFMASITWAMAMTKLQLSQAYPFMSISFILVFILSVLFFNESITMNKIFGYLLIISGIIILSLSKIN
jgi:drug/metabolite transporter (DMT)-like permease